MGNPRVGSALDVAFPVDPLDPVDPAQNSVRRRNAYFTILLTLFSGIGDPFLALTLKKPKENQCFWLRTLKNLRKTFVFAFPRASGDLGGTIGPTTPKKLYITNSRSTAQAAVMLILLQSEDNPPKHNQNNCFYKLFNI